MAMKILPASNLADWINHLAKQYRIIGPLTVDGQTTFEVLQPGETPDLDYTTTCLPPKKAMLPVEEALFQFKSTNGDYQIRPIVEEQPTVLLGVHTCDLHAIDLLDHVFSNGVPDLQYLSRRANITIVSIECLRPCSEHSFCKSMGTVGAPEQFDLHMTDLGEDYAFEIGSSDGVNLLWDFFSFRDPEEDDYARLDKAMSEKWSRFAYRLDVDSTELPSLLSLSYDSPLWAELGERCLSCGACNLVCPTCYCFDVEDEISLDLQSGVRRRRWDSCQLPMFAMVAGGHNFRENRADRLRHRFMRKGKYLQESYELTGCVGCGRCAQVCPVHITPIDVFNQLAKSRTPEVSQEGEVVA
jgi:sulfhydrogenase subunit beta (sulfur reductase)